LAGAVLLFVVVVDAAAAGFLPFFSDFLGAAVVAVVSFLGLFFARSSCFLLRSSSLSWSSSL